MKVLLRNIYKTKEACVMKIASSMNIVKPQSKPFIKKFFVSYVNIMDPMRALK